MLFEIPEHGMKKNTYVHRLQKQNSDQKGNNAEKIVE